MLSFFNKNLSNICDELFDKPIIVANHIMIDINFILYNVIDDLEKEINNIILLICGIPYNDITIIETEIERILSYAHWDNIDIKMDGDSIDNIIINFKKHINDNIVNIIKTHLTNKLIEYIDNIHIREFIKSINIFFDGIPAYSKILEQRRRRMKTYLDSKYKKEKINKIKKSMANIMCDKNTNLYYDYNLYIEYLYSIDISLGPYSTTLLMIANYIEEKMQKYYNNINIYISNGMINGEADFKIFKYIHDNMIQGDISIHSCDSDFIFMAIWYQMIGIVKNSHVNINYINYMNNIKQSYNIRKIINSMLDKYGYFNNISENININVIFDILALLLLFGNDTIPISYELGCELSLKQLYETHYHLYKDNTFLVCLNNKMVISLHSLSKWLQLIKNTNSFSLIILSRFYKLSYTVINNCIEVNKTFNDIVKSNIINDEVLLNNKGYFLENNQFQSYYNYICNISSMETDDIFNRPFKIFYDDFKDAEREYDKITSNINTKEYLMFYISTCLIYFYDFNLYTPYNMMYYGDIIAPSISMLVDYINNMNINEFMNECIERMASNSSERYFNPLTHHIFITPYILEYDVDEIEKTHLEIVLNIMEGKIKGIYYRDNKYFNLKNINPKEYIYNANMLLDFYKNFYIKFHRNKILLLK